MGFGGLYTSITGLMASRQSLDTVSHNITNSNNPGYVRQSAIHANRGYTSISGDKLQVGTGVNVAEIRQIRDEFLDKKIRSELSSFGYHYAKSEILADVEGIFNEITDSGLQNVLQNVMNDFWNNWNELYKEPESLTVRALVHESSVAFTDTVNHLSTQLNDIKQNLNKEITTKVAQSNNILKAIADLNKRIKMVEGKDSPVKANDYRDQRNGLLDNLSQLLPVKSYENAFGEAIVSLNGKDLVSGGSISEIHMENDQNGLGHVYYQNSKDKIDLKGMGDLGGYISARDDSIYEYENRLDELVGAMGDKINELHQGGKDLENQKGINFFEPFSTLDPNDPAYEKIRITAANIRVNPDLANFNKIAVSSSGSKGDGDIAKAIFEARKELILVKYNREEYGKEGFVPGEASMTTDEYYRDLVLELSIERESSMEVAKNQGFLINSIDERRKGISGVSLDEEMTDMIKFQHAYAANSRVINVIDEMIEQIVNRM